MMLMVGATCAHNSTESKTLERTLVVSTVTVGKWDVGGEEYTGTVFQYDVDITDDDDFNKEIVPSNNGLANVKYVTDMDTFVWPQTPEAPDFIVFRALLLRYKREFVTHTCANPNGVGYYECGGMEDIPYYYTIGDIPIQSDEIIYSGKTFKFVSFSDPEIFIEVTFRCVHCGEPALTPSMNVGIKDVQVTTASLPISKLQPYVYCMNYDVKQPLTALLDLDTAKMELGVWTAPVLACGIYNYVPGKGDEYGWAAAVVTQEQLSNGDVIVRGDTGQFTLFVCTDTDSCVPDPIDFMPEHPGSSVTRIVVILEYIVASFLIFTILF